jgi:drug/metabolite transporter (DMT)-like permease
MKGSSVRKAYLFAILAVLFWSTSPTAFKLGLRYLDTWQLLTGAAIGSTLVLGILSLIRGNMRTLRLFTKRDILFSALMGLLNPVAYYLILFRAYTILPAQVAQPLNMVWPIVLVLLSIPILGQRIKWISIGAMVLSFAGVVLITLQGETGQRIPRTGWESSWPSPAL